MDELLRVAMYVKRADRLYIKRVYRYHSDGTVEYERNTIRRENSFA